MDLDALFKKPSLPSTKRKLEPATDPNQLYKAAKLAVNGDATEQRQASVQDEDDEDEEAGPAPPPDDEDEDEEGRFFGGGMTKDAAEALDYVDEQDADNGAPEVIDIGWLRKTALNFEKRISKNAELRAKFEDQPQKFMASEADLDADLKALSILSEYPALYSEFASLGCVASLVSLLTHENTDIAIDAIQIIGELIDEDVEATDEQWDALVQSMLEADILELLMSNFTRLDESIDSDRGGVYQSLSVIESLSSRSSVADKVAGEVRLLKWLLARIQKEETLVSQNKQYAAELLSILLQASSVVRETVISKLDGVEAVLQLVSAYRKRDPEKGGEEEELFENLFSCLTAIVDEPLGKAQFIEAEGVELLLICLREGKMSKPRALRVLDHLVGGLSAAIPACERVVEAAGLKTLFGLLMKSSTSYQDLEHVLGILAALLSNLPIDSAGRIRTVVKFVEKDYEKIVRLVKIRRDLVHRLEATNRTIEEDLASLSVEERREEGLEVVYYSRRLEGGLFGLQLTDLILAWLVAEDQGAQQKIVALLAEQDGGLDAVAKTLKEQLHMLGDENAEEELSVAEQEDKDRREMLQSLLRFL